MKYIYLIAILICLSYQSKEQVIANSSTTNSTTADKLPSNKEGGVIKAQSGTIMGYDSQAERRRRMEFYAKREQEQQATQQAKAMASGKSKEQAAIFTIGIVVLFIIITVIAFCILYTKRNKDNPYLNRN